MVGTYSPNPGETAAFIRFTQHFFQKGLPVPQLLAEDTARQVYLQEDLGDVSLFRLLREPGGAEKYEEYLRKALELLAQFQVRGHQGFDYDWTYSGRAFDHYGMVSDLNYWKYYFLRPLGVNYDGHALDRDFDALVTWLLQSPWQFFMYRDFQSRNIMIKEGRLYGIDYQGGRMGPALYDCASFLWQARSGIDYARKEELAGYYLGIMEKELSAAGGDELPARDALMSFYYGFVLLRLLQVLGAYGYRGLFERKQHFVDSFPLGLENLGWWNTHYTLPLLLPELTRVLDIVSGGELRSKFAPVSAGKPSRLTVSINSFSYKQGLPVDDSGNGGGFIFDCRFIDNPGRKPEYKALSGLDQPVQDYLSTTVMPAFIDQVKQMVGTAVENYLERDFDHIQVNFGCTGGQHRSVYAAESLAAYLRQRYPVRVNVQHLQQDKWPKS